MKIDIASIIANFNRLDLRTRYAIFAGCLAAVFLLDGFTLMAFQWLILQNIESKSQTLEQNIKQVKSDLVRIDQMKASLQRSRTQMETMNMKIRPVTDKDSILDDISQIANQAGVKIDQLTVQGDFQKALISTKTIKYYALPIVIQASSGYHTFGHFINELEQARLSFILSGLTIEDHSGDSRHSINAIFKVVLSDKNTGDHKK